MTRRTAGGATGNRRWSHHPAPAHDASFDFLSDATRCRATPRLPAPALIDLVDLLDLIEQPRGRATSPWSLL